MKTILLSLSMFIYLSAISQTDTTFWFAAPEISSSSNFDRPIVIRITSYLQPCTVTISQPANGGMATQVLNLSSNSTQSIDLTTWIDFIECKPGDVVQNRGIKINSTANISVYYEVNQTGPNPEIFVLKGSNALGNEFYISSQNIGDNGTFSPTPFSSFNIVATEDNTIVTIIPSKDIVGHTVSVPFSVTLNKGQTYAAIATSQLASQHLDGSYITSTKPIAITLSDDLLKTPDYGTCADLTGDQTIPTNVLGNEYIAIKGNLDSPSDKVFVTATNNGTIINQDGAYVTTLNSGESTQLSLTNTSTYVQSSLPIYAYQFSGIGCEFGTAILPPITCTGSSSITIARSTPLELYITVLVKAGGESNFSVNNDTAVLTSTIFTPVPGTSNQWMTAKLLLPILNYPLGSPITISNSASIFHLGVLQGNETFGTSFGYFSNFNTITANAFTPSSHVCEGFAIHLFSDTILSATYNWTGPNGFTSNLQNPVLNNCSPLNSGSYILTINVPGCGKYFDSVSILVTPMSSSTINQTICQGQTYLGYNAAGTYIDTFLTANGCDSIRILRLTVIQQLPQPNLGPDKKIRIGDTLILHPGTFDTYLWQDNSSLDYFTVRQPGLFFVSVTNSCGSNRDEILISEKISNIYFPSAFTPNNDGKNDFFNILNAFKLDDYILTIYNRWGQIVYKTRDYTKGWNGKLNGVPQASGVFVYYCTYKKSNAIIEKKGTVTLIR